MLTCLQTDIFGTTLFVDTIFILIVIKVFVEFERIYT